MKAILLHTAALDNGGTRHEAGDTLAIGDDKSQIDAERAQALVDSGSAVAQAARGR